MHPTRRTPHLSRRSSTHARALGGAALGAAALLAASVPLSGQGATYRVSTSALGAQADQRCMAPSVSHDGRVIAFASRATNLVPNDTNGKQDVFVKDLLTGAIRRASVASSGAQGDGDAWMPALSADGRYVAFESGATTRASVASNGAEADAYSNFAALSGDGRLVAFLSPATNLVANDTNGRQDVFVHDRQTGRTTRESVSSQGVQANDDQYEPKLSADGRVLVFASTSTNLVAQDTNDRQDVFLRDLAAGTTVRVSTGLGGAQSLGDSGGAVVSADGRCIAFASDAPNLVANDTNQRSDVFVLDRGNGGMARVSIGPGGAQGDDSSSGASISADGRCVAFVSDATTLTPRTSPFPDLYVHDRGAGTTTLASQSSGGLLAGDRSFGPAALSGDGRYLAFQTAASNLVPNDVNGADDVLVHEVAHHMRTTDMARIGQPLRLDMHSPLDPGKTYVALAALNTQFGIPLGARLFPLDADPLLSLSLSVPAVFQNFSGTLDGQGRAQAQFLIPNQQVLQGFFFCTGYLVLDPSWQSPFRGLGNALSFLTGR